MKRQFWIALVVLATAIGTWSQAPVDKFHNAPPKKGEKLPPILSKQQLWFTQAPYQRRAYEAAAQHSSVLYQLPCKCHCSATVGHTSLRSCFESTHGAGCDVCMKEAFFAAQQTAKGRTPAQIREGIERSEHNRIDLQTGTAAP